MAFAMHLDIHYVQMHRENNLSRKAKTSYNLEWMEYFGDGNDAFLGNPVCLSSVLVPYRFCVNLKVLT